MPRILLKKSRDGKHKFTAIFIDKNYPSYGKVVRFGSKGHSDFTIHKDEARRRRYLKRHAKEKKYWNYSGILQPSFWARFILWNKPTIDESIKNTNEKFGVHIIWSMKHHSPKP